MTPFEISAKLREHLCEGPERCGLITVSQGVIEVKNEAADPLNDFVIPKKQLMLHEDIRGTWHSHPGKSANLSLEDYYNFLKYPEWEHWIVGKEGAVCYVIDVDEVVMVGCF